MQTTQRPETAVSESDVSASGSAFPCRRRKVVALFCDLRGFTSFADTAEPEEILALLRGYHERLGPLIEKHEGTVYHYFGDGVMLLFNDRNNVADAALRAARLAIEMRAAVGLFTRKLGECGHSLGFGVGIAEGHAVLAHIGCRGSAVYTAIGRVINLASRLCGEALDGQILVSSRVARATAGAVALEPLGQRLLRGFSRPVSVSNVRAAQPTQRPS